MCASEMATYKPELDHEVRNACPKCKYVNYNNAKPTASALILNDEGKVLLVKRSWHPFKDFWDIPGGFVEGPEHPEDGCRREVLEELGVTVELDGFFGIEMDVYSDGKDESKELVSGEGVYTLNLYYIAHIVSGELMITDEIAGFEWFTLKEIEELIDHVAFSTNQKALRKLIAERS